MNVFAEYLLVGDADLNGVVEATDALLTLRASMELMTLEARGLFAADINGNGYSDAEDALSIMRYSMELMDTLVPYVPVLVRDAMFAAVVYLTVIVAPVRVGTVTPTATATFAGEATL